MNTLDHDSLNGLHVIRSRGANGEHVLFIPLPRKYWRASALGQCGCAVCSEVNGRMAYWDTLALAVGDNERSTTWTVHMPEQNPWRLTGAERGA